MSEINSSSLPALRSIRRFADYIVNVDKKFIKYKFIYTKLFRKKIVEEITQELELNQNENDDTTLLMNSLIFTHEEVIFNRIFI